MLLAVPDRPNGAGPPPVVLWLHGFRADALANAAELQRIADAGFLAVGVDAVGHGRRADRDIEARIDASRTGAFPVMLATALATAAEIPALLREVDARGLGDTARAGLVGVSMGAFAVYHAVQTVPVRAAVALLGAPAWAGAGPLREAPGIAYRGPALLSITAECDESVPPHAARALHERLAADPAGSVVHRYLELPGAPHLVDAAGWETMMRATLDWLVTHLR